MADLLTRTDRGLYCEAGDFYVDPWRPVERAVVTHAHADHARRGMGSYLTTPEGAPVLRPRMGEEATIQTAVYGETVEMNGVRVSLHPAGHILGSAQVRVEHRGEVWCVSGDYKLGSDRTCATFEPVRCHTFITESTFGLPIYRWPDQAEVFRQMNEWWAANRAAGKVSVLFAYALGKAQRLLAGADASIGPIYGHGAVQVCNAGYWEAGIELPPCEYAGRGERGKDWDGALVVAPPGARGTPWLRKFRNYSTAFASGWMLVRGQRRRRSVDRGFVMSDHADWPGLLQTVRDTGCERCLITHGSRRVMERYLNSETEIEAAQLETWFEGENDTAGEEADAEMSEAGNEGTGNE